MSTTGLEISCDDVLKARDTFTKDLLLVVVVVYALFLARYLQNLLR